MNRYITYQCTVCRRTKDVERDNIRAIPSGCTITKGCGGTLFKVGDKGYAEQTPPVAGVTDWYPRGTNPLPATAKSEPEYVELSSSSSGAIVLAVKMTEAQANVVSSLTLKMQQRRVEAIPFTQFTFRILLEGVNTVSGRDSQGKILRIDSTAQAEGRLRVRVNGVIVPNVTVSSTVQSATVTFAENLPLQSVVDIVVFNEKEVEDKELEFVTNRTIAVNDLSGAWGNVRWVDKLNPTISSNNEERFWLYTCTSTAKLPSTARIKVLGLYYGTTLIPAKNVLMLMGSSPYSHVDRYLGIAVPLTACQNAFNILTSNKPTRDFTIEKQYVESIYPVLSVKRGYTPQTQSLTSADVIPENSGAIPTDSSTTLLTNKYVNGPV